MKVRSTAATAVAALIFVTAACGSDDDSATATAPGEASSASTASDSTAGSTAEPSDSTGAPASTSGETAAGAEDASDPLAPKPLAERASIILSLPAKLTAASPYIAAGFLGEFDKENLDVEVKVVDSQSSMQLLSQGETDVLLGSYGAGTLNRIASGLEVRAVFPNQVPNEESKEGLWVRKSVAGDDGILQADELAGKTVYSVSGCGDALFKFWDHINESQEGDGDITATDMTCEPFSVPDTHTALQNGSIEVALVLSPFWQQLENNDCCLFVSPFGEPPTGALFFGPNLLTDAPEVGQAFIRAISRTIRDNFQGDWTANTELVANLAAELEIPPEAITSVPPTNFGTGIPADELAWMPSMILERTQEDFFAKEEVMGIELLSYDEPLTYDQVYAPRFLEELDN